MDTVYWGLVLQSFLDWGNLGPNKRVSRFSARRGGDWLLAGRWRLLGYQGEWDNYSCFVEAILNFSIKGLFPNDVTFWLCPSSGPTEEKLQFVVFPHFFPHIFPRIFPQDFHPKCFSPKFTPNIYPHFFAPRFSPIALRLLPPNFPLVFPQKNFSILIINFYPLLFSLKFSPIVLRIVPQYVCPQVYSQICPQDSFL